MHIQIRSVPATSPPDLAKFLGVLAEAGVNLVAAGGGGLELRGELAFAPAHEDDRRAVDALVAAGYKPRVLNAEAGDFKLCWLENKPGALYRCLADAASENLRAGRVVQDILVWLETDDLGRIPVQVYSVARLSEIAAGGETGA